MMAVDAPNTYNQLLSKVRWFLFYASGVIGMLVLYGILQERIMTKPYNGEHFTYSVFLVFCNRVFAGTFALLMALCNRESCSNKAPLWKYVVVSMSNVCASACQYEALKYVSFAVQMLGKSFSLMPVMVWSMVLFRKSYTLHDWGLACVTTFGVEQFLTTGPIHDDDHSNTAKGLILLCGFLAFDGFTSTMQEKLFKDHATSKYNQMMYINGFSAWVSLIALIFSNTLMPVLAFCGRNPSFIGDAALLAVSAVAGQSFIYSQVKEFGALVFAVTMNFRQVISILVSYAMYRHPMTTSQCLGLVVFFTAVFYRSFRALIRPFPPSAERVLLLPKDAGSEASYESSANANMTSPKAGP